MTNRSYNHCTQKRDCSLEFSLLVYSNTGIFIKWHFNTYFKNNASKYLKKKKKQLSRYMFLKEEKKIDIEVSKKLSIYPCMCKGSGSEGQTGNKSFSSECQLEMRAARQRDKQAARWWYKDWEKCRKQGGDVPKRREAETLPIQRSDLWLLGA